MKVKTHSKILLSSNKSISPAKFYEATPLTNGFYAVEVGKDHRVILSKKQIKEIKE